MTKIRVVTHSGKYHADDVFAVATLDILLDPEEIIIIRTRDQKLIDEADYVVDVGGVYDREKKRFDHHQREGAGERENGIPYASFGLVWKEYGEKVAGSRAAQEYIDQKLVQAIDGPDNGVEIWNQTIEGVSPYTIESALYAFRSTWKEHEMTNDDVFVGMVALAKKILKREIEIAETYIEATAVARNVIEDQDSEIVIFSKDHQFGREVIGDVLSQYEKPMYAVLYRPDPAAWQVLAVNVNGTLEMRKPLKEEWMGKSGEELQKVSGIPDAIFCHRVGFMAMVESKEGAMELAKKALEA